MAKTINQNGVYNPLEEPTPVDGYSEVTVNVPQVSGTFGSRIIEANGTYIASQDGYDGYDSVTVNIESGGGGGFDPDDYSTYLQSNGNQYIDTGYKVKDNTRIEVVADIPTSNNQYATLFGTRATNGESQPSDQCCVMFAKYNNAFKVNWGSSLIDLMASQATTIFFYDYKALYTFKKGNAVADTGETVIGIPFTATGSATQAYNLYLLNLDQAGSSYGSVTGCIAKIYSVKIYEGDTLVMNLTPFIDSNNVACFKDLVSGNLLYNAGSGTFTYGEDS